MSKTIRRSFGDDKPRRVMVQLSQRRQSKEPEQANPYRSNVGIAKLINETVNNELFRRENSFKAGDHHTMLTIKSEQNHNGANFVRSHHPQIRLTHPVHANLILHAFKEYFRNPVNPRILKSTKVGEADIDIGRNFDLIMRRLIDLYSTNNQDNLYNRPGTIAESFSITEHCTDETLVENLMQALTEQLVDNPLKFNLLQIAMILHSLEGIKPEIASPIIEKLTGKFPANSASITTVQLAMCFYGLSGQDPQKSLRALTELNRLLQLCTEKPNLLDLAHISYGAYGHNFNETLAKYLSTNLKPIPSDSFSIKYIAWLFKGLTGHNDSAQAREIATTLSQKLNPHFPISSETQYKIKDLIDLLKSTKYYINEIDLEKFYTLYSREIGRINDTSVHKILKDLYLFTEAIPEGDMRNKFNALLKSTKSRSKPISLAKPADEAIIQASASLQTVTSGPIQNNIVIDGIPMDIYIPANTIKNNPAINIEINRLPYSSKVIKRENSYRDQYLENKHKIKTIRIQKSNVAKAGEILNSYLATTAA